MAEIFANSSSSVGVSAAPGMSSQFLVHTDPHHPARREARAASEFGQGCACSIPEQQIA
jgi:hypothetical protein